MNLLLKFQGFLMWKVILLLSKFNSRFPYIRLAPGVRHTIFRFPHIIIIIGIWTEKIKGKIRFVPILSPLHLPISRGGNLRLSQEFYNLRY